MRRLAFALVLLLLLVGCRSRSNVDSFTYVGQRNLDRAYLGDEWPLAVEEGTLQCFGSGQAMLEVDRVQYAVTGFDDDVPGIDEIAVADTGPLVHLVERICP